MGGGPVSSVGCRFHLEGARLHSCEIREGGFGEANTGGVVKEELLEGGANFREVLDTEEGFKDRGRS